MLLSSGIKHSDVLERPIEVVLLKSVSVSNSYYLQIKS